MYARIHAKKIHTFQTAWNFEMVAKLIVLISEVSLLNPTFRCEMQHIYTLSNVRKIIFISHGLR